MEKPTHDSILWLRKVGLALQQLGVCSGCRVRVSGWETSGQIYLDLEYSRDGGGRSYVAVPVPISAAKNHDTRFVLTAVGDTRNLTLHERSIMAGVILRETDLAHVH